jgi:poly(3-hydroxybutyrate) depolymerase
VRMCPPVKAAGCALPLLRRIPRFETLARCAIKSVEIRSRSEPASPVTAAHLRADVSDLYAFYQVPQNPKPLPIVMLHGAFQSARSWEMTSDGREGFQTLFLRRGFPVHLVDHAMNLEHRLRDIQPIVIA